MDTMTYNDNNKYTKGKMCLDKLVSEHDKQIKKKLIEKAIGWIDYNNENGGCNFNEWEKDFKKAMMGE